MPLPGIEMPCFDPIKTIGYFSLIREDEIAYETPQSLLSINTLVPLPDPLIEHNQKSTFINLTEDLSLGFTGINANDCRFIIDIKQPHNIKLDNLDKNITSDHLFVGDNIKTVELSSIAKPQKTKSTAKEKVLKNRYSSRDILTDLIHHFLATENIFPGNPKTFGSKIAWNKLMLEYENEKNLIASKHNDNRGFILNSVEEEQINEKVFSKRYNAQFITKD